MQLELAEVAEAPRLGAANQPSAERVKVILEPSSDFRPDYQRNGAGHMGRPVVADNLLGWIDRSLRGLQGRHFAITAADDASAWRVAPRLHQFYAAPLAVSKNAHVVLELEIRAPDGTARKRVYRGRVNAVNWWNSTGEIEGALVSAMEDCLKRIAVDLDKIVSEPPSPTTAARL